MGDPTAFALLATQVDVQLMTCRNATSSGGRSETTGRRQMRVNRRFRQSFRALCVGLCLLLPNAATAADTVASFYAGKTIRMAISGPPGSGYDLYARLL